MPRIYDANLEEIRKIDNRARKFGFYRVGQRKYKDPSLGVFRNNFLAKGFEWFLNLAIDLVYTNTARAVTVSYHQPVFNSVAYSDHKAMLVEVDLNKE